MLTNTRVKHKSNREDGSLRHRKQLSTECPSITDNAMPRTNRRKNSFEQTDVQRQTTRYTASRPPRQKATRVYPSSRNASRKHRDREPPCRRMCAHQTRRENQPIEVLGAPARSAIAEDELKPETRCQENDEWAAAMRRVTRSKHVSQAATYFFLV